MIEQNGFYVIKIIKLPVTTGYSFKMKRFCDLLYRIGFSSTYAYVAVKNRDSKLSKYFKWSITNNSIEAAFNNDDRFVSSTVGKIRTVRSWNFYLQ